jgi:hypothetical protein
MGRLVLSGSILLALTLTVLFAQGQSTPAGISGSGFTADYPADRAGILVHASAWEALAAEAPSKTKAAHGIAASLSYGAVPVKMVAEYEGEHASIQLDGRLILCVCHVMSIPGKPVIIRLHSKKGGRELDGGRMTEYPIVGNAKTADANRSDLLPIDVAQPETNVWLIRPQAPLPPGEYALMLGTQNVMIYPFTVTSAVMDAAGH